MTHRNLKKIIKKINIKNGGILNFDVNQDKRVDNILISCCN